MQCRNRSRFFFPEKGLTGGLRKKRKRNNVDDEDRPYKATVRMPRNLRNRRSKRRKNNISYEDGEQTKDEEAEFFQVSDILCEGIDKDGHVRYLCTFVGYSSKDALYILEKDMSETVLSWWNEQRLLRYPGCLEAEIRIMCV